MNAYFVPGIQLRTIVYFHIVKNQTQMEPSLGNSLSRQIRLVIQVKLNLAYSVKQAKLNLGPFLLMPLKIINET